MNSFSTVYETLVLTATVAPLLAVSAFVLLDAAADRQAQARAPKQWSPVIGTAAALANVAPAATQGQEPQPLRLAA